MRKTLTALVVGLALSLFSAATSEAADYYGVPTWTPRLATGVGRPCNRGVDVTYHREIFHYPEACRVPPVAGYEYLYDRNQARTVGGYTRMFMN